MDWRAANERRRETLLRVFLMLVVRAVLVLRADLEPRRASALSIGSPPFPGDTPADPHQPFSASPADFRRAVLDLLCAAHAVARRLIATMREDYELMKQAYSLARSTRERISEAAGLCDRPVRRLDTS